MRCIVAGTGFENRRDNVIRWVENDAPIKLKRDPSNEFDPNAIAVCIKVKFLFGLIQFNPQIGYIKKSTAKSVAKKLDTGMKYRAWVTSYHAPEGRDHPRVSIEINFQP